MTHEEFLAALWELPARRWALFGPQHAIRLDVGEDVSVCCPITALCLARTGKFVQTYHWPVAAEQLGLSAVDACLIVAAADNAPGASVTLREALLGATVWREAPAPGDLLGGRRRVGP